MILEEFILSISLPERAILHRKIPRGDISQYSSVVQIRDICVLENTHGLECNIEKVGFQYNTSKMIYCI